jgi:hypothetical protein
MTKEEHELSEKIYKRFQTTMIGALARFENIFGYLWDADTAEGDKYADMWEYARNSILNNGNKQARAAIDDIGDTFNKLNPSNKVNNTYSYKFNLKNDSQEKGENYED